MSPWCAYWGAALPVPNGSLARWQHANFEVAIPDRIAMILKDDMSLPPVAKAGNILVFAGSEGRVHLGGAQIECHDLGAVEPMLSVVTIENDARMIKLTDNWNILCL